jgi:PPOX class probable F420-dependent enzyme
MAASIPASHMRLLTDPIVAHLATLLSDGRPQVNPVWCDYDGTYVRVNAAADRQKTRNMRRRGFATVFLVDGPYFWMEIRGRVIHSTTEGAMDHMHSMARKYTGRDTSTPIRTGEVYVISRSDRSESSRSERGTPTAGNKSTRQRYVLVVPNVTSLSEVI